MTLSERFIPIITGVLTIVMVVMVVLLALQLALLERLPEGKLPGDVLRQMQDNQQLVIQNQQLILSNQDMMIKRLNVLEAK